MVGYLRDTQNYIRAGNAGLSIFDLPPSSTRQDRQQWEPILEWLDCARATTSNAMQEQINELLGL